MLEKLPACHTGEEAARVFDEVLLKRAPGVEALDEKVMAGVWTESAGLSENTGEGFHMLAAQ